MRTGASLERKHSSSAASLWRWRCSRGPALRRLRPVWRHISRYYEIALTLICSRGTLLAIGLRDVNGECEDILCLIVRTIKVKTRTVHTHITRQYKTFRWGKNMICFWALVLWHDVSYNANHFLCDWKAEKFNAEGST